MLMLVLLYLVIFSWNPASADDLPEIFMTVNESARNVACYGQNAWITAGGACPSHTVIALNAVKVGAKAADLGCPSNSETFNDTCCMPALTEDCVFTFSYNLAGREALHKYHHKCSGRRMCTGAVPAVHAQTTNCGNAHSYGNTTNYMFLEHACINEGRIFRLNSSGFEEQRTGFETLYLMSKSYPENTTAKSTFVQECQISSKTSIDLYTLDIRFVNESGACQQSLNINNQATFDCFEDDPFDGPIKIRKLGLLGRVLNLTFSSNSMTNAGLFWIGFTGTDLTINCSLVSSNSVPIPPSSQPSSEESGFPLAAIIGIVVAIILLVLAVLICIICRCKKSKKSGKQGETPDPENNVKAGDISRNTMFNPKVFPFIPRQGQSSVVENGSRLGRGGRLPPLDNERSSKPKKRKKMKRNKVEPSTESND